MSSHKFESLDEEVEALLDQVADELEFGLSRCNGQGERKMLLSEIERMLNDATGSLLDMDIESKKAPVIIHEYMNSKVMRYQNEVARYRRQLDREKSSNYRGDDRSALLSNDEDVASLDALRRKQVQRGTAILERTSESIARSTTIAVETEQVGTEVLGELGAQRETLTRTRDRLIDTDAELSRSKKIIRAMSRNVLYNRILLIIIILLEVGILGGLVYWKFFT
ncbi:vesicle transport through interaction with t-SNAREs homolog 1B [Palaemon carinicauda]|uniref:vesicle transport through interaction with t-SNAREs homolog 1B n=1 Tax=Palaemon carinicauda TaxID=392227 RepID=UPI0035B5CA56